MMRSHKTVSGPVITGIILLAAAGLLSAAARSVPGFAQAYSCTVYPVLQSTIGRIAGLLPFSAAEVLCILLPVFLVFDLIRMIRHKSRKNVVFRRFGSHLFLVIAVLLFMYQANCGVNYYREPFVGRAAFEAARFTEDDLTGFCELAVRELQQSSAYYNEGADNEGADSDTAGDASPGLLQDQDIYPDKRELAQEAVHAMEKLSSASAPAFNDYSSLSGFYPPPKYLTFMSRLFSAMGVSGIYSPFTIEANVNGEMTGLEKPFTSCHELSHLKGFMNEGEANYIGWLACIGSDDPAFNRSGWLIAWTYAGNSLYRIDPEKYSELRKKLPDDVIRELDDNREFWETHETRASEVQDRVNDAYLKSNGLKDGVQSYGQLTTLMLMWYTESNV